MGVVDGVVDGAVEYRRALEIEGQYPVEECGE